jgi:tetratricopeptide (TPR) repeat protein
MTKKYLLYICFSILSFINISGQTIPEAAREKYIMGITLRGQAKSVSDYDLPIAKFKDAILLAPTWPEVYKELGLTLELAGKFDDAIINLNKYISFNPPSDDARKAQDEIYIIKAKKEKAESEQKKEGSVYEPYLGTWQLNDELRKVGGDALSPVADVALKSIKTGEVVVFQLNGSDFLRVSFSKPGGLWEFWKPIPYKSIGCPEDGAWNKIEMSGTPDKKSMSFTFFESYTGTCGHQMIHKYTVYR